MGILIKSIRCFSGILSAGILFSSALLHAVDIPPDMLRIEKNGKLRVAMFFEDVPPFFMKDSTGIFTGLDVELSEDIAKRLGVSVEYNRDAKTFDELVDVVLARKADVVISILSQTLSRARRVCFTSPYLVLHQSLLINRLQAAHRKEKNLPLLLNSPLSKIGVMRGTSYVDFVKEDYAKANIVLYDSFESMAAAVMQGKMLALFYDEIEIKNWHKKNPEGALYVQTAILQDKKDPIAMAVHFQDTHFLSWLNIYLEAIKIDGTHERLLKKYLEIDLSAQDKKESPK